MMNEWILQRASCTFMGEGVGRAEEVRGKAGEEMALELAHGRQDICTQSVALLNILF